MTENDYRLLYDIASKRNTELEQENARLKNILTSVISLENAYSFGKQEGMKQLTKATELLNEFMRIGKASDEDFEHDYSELIGETEQFLKDM